MGYFQSSGFDPAMLFTTIYKYIAGASARVNIFIHFFIQGRID